MKTKTKKSVSQSQPVQSSDLAVKELQTVAMMPESQAVATIEAAISNDKQTLEGVSSSDVVSFVSFALNAAVGGMRRAILAIDASIRTGEAFAGEVKSALETRYAKPTVACIYTAARRTVPALRDIGVNPADVDVYNLRAVNPALGDKTHKAHKAVVAAIKCGKSTGETVNAYKAATGKAERAPAGKAVVTEPAKTVNSTDGIIARIKADIAEIARDKTFGEKQTRYLLLKMARQMGATPEEFNQAVGKKR